MRTLASHEGYYERWAKTWEFQALLKARPVAGDLDARPGVRASWSRRWCGRRPSATGSSTDVQAMRRRVVEHIPAAQAERQLKLGSGGLRDVEFAVQLLQLVHGRADDAVRAPTTLSRAGAAHRAAGTSAARTAPRCDDAYRFLRTLEHRIQLYQLRRTHVLPDDEASLRRLGRSHGLHAASPSRSSTRSGAGTAARSAGCTRSCSTGRCSPRSPGSRPTRRGSPPRPPQQRLAALGYADPAAALRHLEALTAGVSRRTANIQRTLLPAMLGWFADAPEPGRRAVRLPAGLSEALGHDALVPPDAARRGRRSPSGSRTLLATSRYATDLLAAGARGRADAGDDEALQPLEPRRPLQRR